MIRIVIILSEDGTFDAEGGIHQDRAYTEWEKKTGADIVDFANKMFCEKTGKPYQEFVQNETSEPMRL